MNKGFIFLGILLGLTSCSFIEKLWNPGDIGVTVNLSRGEFQFTSFQFNTTTLVVDNEQKFTIHCLFNSEFKITNLKVDLSAIGEKTYSFVPYNNNNLDWYLDTNVKPTVLGENTLYFIAVNEKGKIISNTYTITVIERDLNIYVSKTWGNDDNEGIKVSPLKTIQAGIKKAKSNNVTIVYVAEGNYNEVDSVYTTANIVLSDLNGMTLKGGWSSNFSVQNPSVYRSVIDGENNVNNVFFISAASNITIEGFTIKGAKYSATYGGGLRSVNSLVNVLSCTIISNVSQRGGAAYIQNSGFVISNSTIYNNLANYGGAFYIFQTENGTIVGNSIATNSVSNSGGAFFIMSSHPKLLNNTIESNTCNNDGGAIYFSGSSSVLTNNVFRQNKANYGGALFMVAGSKLSIVSNTFDGNNSKNIFEASGNDNNPTALQYNRFLNMSVLYCDDANVQDVADVNTLNLLDDSGYNPSGTVLGNN